MLAIQSALMDLLVEKGIFTFEELQRQKLHFTSVINLKLAQVSDEREAGKRAVQPR
jgi:hypothetical protein